MATRLERIIDVAEDAARGFEAANRLRQGKNGEAAVALATLVERRIRDATASLMKKRRKANTAHRDKRGRFTG